MDWDREKILLSFIVNYLESTVLNILFNNVISYWNNLPSNVVEAGPLELFKCKLKSFLKL